MESKFFLSLSNKYFFVNGYNLSLNVFGAYLYTRYNDTKQYKILNITVAIPKENKGNLNNDEPEGSKA